MPNLLALLFKYVMQGIITALAGYFVMFGEKASLIDIGYLALTAMIIYVIFDVNCAVSATLRTYN